MSWTLKQSAVGSASGNAGKTVSATFPSAVTPGNMLLVLIHLAQTSSAPVVSNVTDSASNSYANLNASFNINPEYGTSGTYGRVGIWAAFAASAATPTVTVTASAAGYLNVVLAELSFAGFHPVLDNAESAAIAAGSGSLSPGNVTVSGTDLVLGFGSQLNSSNPTWTNASGYTTLENVAWSANTLSLQVEYLLNTTTSPMVPSLTSSQTVAGMAAGLSLKQVVPSYTLTGPGVGLSGIASSPFTVTPGAAATDTITFSDGGAGGTFVPTSFTFANSSAAQTVQYTPPATGSTFTLTFTSAAGGAIAGSPLAYTIVTPGSFHTTGNLFLQTVGNNLFSQQSSASVSFFVKFNSYVSGVSGGTTTFSGTLLTRTGYQGLYAMSASPAISTGAMRYGLEGTGAGVSASSVPFFDGAVTHIAMTWSPTQQTVWVNGAIAAQTNTLSALTGDSQARPLELGWQSANGTTLDCQIANLAIWNGYTLTSTDVFNLLYGLETPMGVSTPPTSYWPFGGTSGNAMALGDPGLADAGSAGLPFIEFELTNPSDITNGTATTNNGTLTYGGPLVYTPPATPVPYVTKSGGLIIFGFVSSFSSSTIAYPTAINSNPVVSVNGSVVPIVGPYWTMTTQQWPFVAYQLETPVTPSDTLTYTASSQWAVTTVGSTGLIATPAPIANYTGQLEPGFGGQPPFGMPSGTPPMALGFDVDWPSGQAGINYSITKNWLHRTMYQWNGANSVDANGHPIEIAGTAWSLVIFTNLDNYVDGMAWPMVTGVWTLIADEAAPNTPMTVSLNQYYQGASSINVTALPVVPGVINSSGVEVGKQWSWTVSYSANATSWDQSLRISVTTYNAVNPGPWTLSNEFLFAPTVNGSPLPLTRTNPLAIDSNMANAVTTPSGKTPHILRFVDNVLSYDGYSSMVDPTDLKSPTAFGWATNASSPTATRSIGVSSIRNYSLTAATGTPGSPYVYTNQWGTPTAPGSPGPYVITPSSIAYANPNPPTSTTQWFLGEVVTSQPHNLKSGQILTNWTNFRNITITNGSGGGTVVTNSIALTGVYLIWVTGATTFVLAQYAPEVSNTNASGLPGGINNVVGSQTLTGASVTIYVPDTATIPYECAAAVTSSYANTYLWVNVPVAATDACVAAIAQRVRDNTQPGRRVYVEYSNEVWSNVAQNHFVRGLSTLGFLRNDEMGSYALRASQIHNNFISVFNQVDVNGNSNRGGEIVRLFGSQWDYLAITQSLINHVNSYNRTTPSVAATAVATGSGGTLPPGAYYLSYTYVRSGGGETTWGTSRVTSPVTIASGQELVISFNDIQAPGWASARNLYLTAAGGAAGTETLYATGITTPSYTAASGSWDNGTTTQSLAAALPTANTTVIPSSFSPIQVDAVAIAPYPDMPNESRSDPTVAATVNATGGGATGGSLAAGTYYVSYTWVDGASGLETGQGASLVTFKSGPTVQATGTASGTTGSLPAGQYIVSYSYVASGPGGETDTGRSRSWAINVAAGNVLTITFNDGGLPSWAVGRNVYLTAPNGAAESETLYATGVTTATFAASSASWTNGTTTQFGALVYPAANTTGVGTAFTIAAGNIPTVTIAFPNPNWTSSANIYLTQPGSPPGPAVKYLSGVTTTTVNLTAANTGSAAPPTHGRVPSIALAAASIWSGCRNSIAYGNPMASWTRAMFLELYRHHLHYSSLNIQYNTGHNQSLNTYVPVNSQGAGFMPALVCYEGAIQTIVPSGVGTDGAASVNLRSQLCHDIFYDPAIYDAEIEFLRSVSAAGVEFMNTLAMAMPLFKGYYMWSYMTWGGQPWGRGDGSDGKAVNQFAQTTGLSQHHANVTVKLQAWRDWADAANVAGLPVPYLKRRRPRWTPPRLGLRVGR